MSNAHFPPHTTGHGSAPAGGAEDDVNIRKIVAVGVVSLLIFALSAVVAHLILTRDEVQLQKRGVAPLVRGLGKRDEIGIVDTVPFDGDRRLDRWRDDKARALTSYGWVDRKKGIIHIPVQEAIKEVIRQTPPPPPPPSPPGGAR